MHSSVLLLLTSLLLLRFDLLHHLLLLFLLLLRWLNCVTDRDTLTGTDEFGEIGVETVLGKSGHGKCIAVLVLKSHVLRQGRTRDLRCLLGILRIGLVEVTRAEQQNSIGMLLLEVVELLEDWSEGRLLVLFLLLFLFLLILPLLLLFLFLLVSLLLLDLFLLCQGIGIDRRCHVKLVVALVIGEEHTLPLVLTDLTGFLLFSVDGGDKEDLRVVGLKGIDIADTVQRLLRGVAAEDVDSLRRVLRQLGIVLLGKLGAEGLDMGLVTVVFDDIEVETDI